MATRTDRLINKNLKELEATIRNLEMCAYNEMRKNKFDPLLDYQHGTLCGLFDANAMTCKHIEYVGFADGSMEANRYCPRCGLPIAELKEQGRYQHYAENAHQ